MKTKKIIYYILMFLPLAVTLIALRYLPDRIPAHYGFDNQVTRWGSKYEAFAYPAATILMGCFLLAMAKFSAKQEKHGENNKNVIIVTGIFVLLLFNVLNGYALYTAMHKIENLSSISFDMYQIVFGFAGLLMIVVGNIMQKVRRNSVAGLRTRWSVKNEATWKKCQRAGGISFIIGGIITAGICVVLKGTSCMIASLCIWLLLLAADFFLTYRIARKN